MTDKTAEDTKQFKVEGLEIIGPNTRISFPSYDEKAIQIIRDSQMSGICSYLNRVKTNSEQDKTAEELLREILLEQTPKEELQYFERDWSEGIKSEAGKQCLEAMERYASQKTSSLEAEVKRLEEQLKAADEDKKGLIQMMENEFQWAKVKDGKVTFTTSEETWNVYKKYVEQCLLVEKSNKLY